MMARPAAPAEPAPGAPHLRADADGERREARGQRGAARRLGVGDRNLLRFHYGHGVALAPLADMFCTPRPALVRQLARIRARLLRDTRRGLAARLALGKPELDRLTDVVRQRLELALTRVL